MDSKATKKYLMKYAGLKMKVENQLERIARAENNTQIPAMKQSDGSQRQPGGDRFGSSVIKYLDIKERLLPSIEANLAEMRKIENAVDNMENSFESEVLHLRYLDTYVDEDGREVTCRLMPWKPIAMKLYGDDDEKHVHAAHRLHGRALQSLAKIIEEDADFKEETS